MSEETPATPQTGHSEAPAASKEPAAPAASVAPAQGESAPTNGAASNSPTNPTAPHKNPSHTPAGRGKGRAPSGQKGGQNALQDRFLSRLRRSNTPVLVTLNGSGAQLEGRVTGFDSFCLVLATAQGEALIYKHGVASLLNPSETSGGGGKKSSRGRRGDRHPDTRQHNRHDAAKNKPATASLREILATPAADGATPAEAKPAKPTESQSVESKPVESKPAESKPAEGAPKEATPKEAQEHKPPEATSSTETSTKPSTETSAETSAEISAETSEMPAKESESAS